MRVLLTSLSLIACSHLAAAPVPNPKAKLISLDYQGFSIQYNCQKRGFESFNYTSFMNDKVSVPEVEPYDEKRLPYACRQSSSESYSRSFWHSKQYERGYGVFPWMFTFDPGLYAASKSMANQVPIARELRESGLWRYTQKLVECGKKKEVFKVWGGNLWGNNSKNDYFADSHGVVTPDYLWKVIQKHNGETQAWLYPNKDSVTAKQRDKYLVSVAKIEALSGITLPVKNKQQAARSSWSLPSGCSLD